MNGVMNNSLEEKFVGSILAQSVNVHSAHPF